MIGGRKLLAWILVFGLCAFATYTQKDIPAGAREILIFVTGFFFGANAVKPMMKNLNVSVGPKK